MYKAVHRLNPICLDYMLYTTRVLLDRLMTPAHALSNCSAALMPTNIPFSQQQSVIGTNYPHLFALPRLQSLLNELWTLGHIARIINSAITLRQ